MNLSSKFSGELRQDLSQKQTISMEVKQSLSVLQMPFYELTQFLEQQQYENPFIEISNEGTSENDCFEPIEMSPGENDDVDHLENMGNFPLEGSEPYEKNGLSSFNSRFGYLEYRNELLCVEKYESFSQMLLEQISSLAIPQKEKVLCEYLVDCLNERGYLDFELADIAFETQTDEYDVAQALFALQSLQPTGVGARSLSECLMLQLAQSTMFCPQTIRIVKDGLGLVAKNDIRGLSKVIHCSIEETATYVAAIRGLNPIPSQGYDTGDRIGYIIPECVIQVSGQDIVISMNHGSDIKIVLNDEYIKMLNQDLDKTTYSYLHQKHSEAKSLIRAVTERDRTLERVIACIVTMQKAYFIDGKSLIPMRMDDIAGMLGMHISTISRTVKDKYIRCRAGTVSLKSLFTTSIASQSSDSVSSVVVKQRIANLIKSENKEKPLSDEAIRIALQTMGLCVSRRTVAKYREEANIPKISIRRER